MNSAAVKRIVQRRNIQWRHWQRTSPGRGQGSCVSLGVPCLLLFLFVVCCILVYSYRMSQSVFLLIFSLDSGVTVYTGGGSSNFEGSLQVHHQLSVLEKGI